MPELPETPEFLERLRRRDPKACRQMITALGPDLEAYAVHLLGDSGGVDDVVQDSLIAALESLPGFDGRSRVRTWLFSIVHHKAVDRIRRDQRSRARDVPLDPRGPEATARGGTHLRRKFARVATAQASVSRASKHAGDVPFRGAGSRQPCVPTGPTVGVTCAKVAAANGAT